LAFLVFVTSTGLAVDVHYCQGHIKTVNVFGKAKGCSDLEMIVRSCAHQDENTAGDTLGRRKCCENAMQYFQPNQNQFSQSSNSVSSVHAQFHPVQSVVVTYTNLIVDHQTSVFSCYKPPPLQRDIPVLLQNFLF